MELKFKTSAGDTIVADPNEPSQQPRVLGEFAGDSNAGQLETSDLLRKEIEKQIRSLNGDPVKAAMAICVMLDERLGLAENGFFDNDEAVIDAISNANQDDDRGHSP